MTVSRFERREERHDTAADWAASNEVLLTGEIGVETDTGKHKIGDGVTAWSGLPYFLNETQLNAAYAGKGNANPSLASLPRFAKAVRSYDDSAKPTLRVIGLGSSVGLGPNGTLDATNSVSRKVFDGISSVFNRLGNLALAHTNASVGGSTITSGTQTDYDAAKTTAGGTPNVLVLTYGMNDGRSGQYHANETYPGVYANGKTLIQRAQADGADVVILTTPHPHTERDTWDMGGMSVIYPANGQQIPDSTYAQSVVDITSPSGGTVKAQYRHLRVNQALRQLGTDMGCAVIDVEPYWFDAVAKYGQDALFDAGQVVHPNLFAFQHTYHQAIADFFDALATSAAISAQAPATTEQFVRKANNTARSATTTLADDPELTISAGANDVWLIEAEIHYGTSTTADLQICIGAPADAGGRWAIVAPGQSATGLSDVAVARSCPVAPGYWMPAGGNGADGIAKVSATVRMGATAGSIAIQWAQATSDASNTIVYADSSLRATKIA